jgi:hypothetical protein
VDADDDKTYRGQALGDQPYGLAERSEIIEQANNGHRYSSDEYGQRLVSAWMNYSRGRRYCAASDRDPAKVGGGHDVNPVRSRLVNQVMPDRDPAHDLGKDHYEDERQEPCG